MTLSPAVGAVPSVLICAAGASSRMGGRDKLMEEVRGRALLEDRVAVALAALEGSAAPLLVALDPARPGRAALLTDLAVQRVPVPEAGHGRGDGLGASIAAGARAAPPERGLMIMLADMPDLTCDDLRKMLSAAAASPDRVLRGCTAGGEPGHPVVFPAALLPELAALSGDAGARALLQGREVMKIALPGRHALTDLDTPEAWAAWRRGDGA